MYPILLVMESADFVVTSPKGTDGGRSEKLFSKYFPQYVTQGTIAVLIQSLEPNTSVICEYTHNLTQALEAAATTGYARDPGFVTEFASYWTYVDQGYGASVGSQFVSPDNVSMLIDITIRERGSRASQAFAGYFSRALKAANTSPKFSVERTGDEYLMLDFNSNSIKDILVTDSVSAVIALCVLLLLINRLTMMLIPFLNLVVSACVGIGLLFPFTYVMDVTSYAPAIILAVLIAMTIDFSLFFLVRFRQEVQPYENVTNSDSSAADVVIITSVEGYDKAVARAVYSAGKVICVSGSTLALAFVGMTIMGVGYLLSISIGAAISLVLIVLVNLSLGPALLYAAPHFFGIHGVLPCCCCCNSCCSSSANSGGEFGVTSDDKEAVAASRWYRIAAILTTSEGAALIIALVLLAMLPIMMGVKDFRYGIENSLVYTDDLPSMAAVAHMGEHFSPGSMYPFYMVAHTKTSSAQTNISTFSEFFFAEFLCVIDDINARTNNSVDAAGGAVVSPAYAGGHRVPFWAARQLTTPGSRLYNTTHGAMYRALLDKMTTPDRRGSVALVVIDTDPMGAAGLRWIRTAQTVLRNHTAHTDYEWGLTNAAVSMFETSAKAYRNFPLMVGVTCGAVIAIVALIFRSVLLPLRLLVTLGLTITWTYGLASLVFCDGALDWTGLELGALGELYWVVPVIVITIIFGLGVDYDVFLFTRVTEYRAKGLSTTDAIRFGYYHTGSIITGAGVVMAIAFSGLMISRQRILQHLGFFLSTSVLLDTFIIRMLLVPALLYFLGDLNWWPSSIVRRKQKYSEEDAGNDDGEKTEVVVDRKTDSEEDEGEEEEINVKDDHNISSGSINGSSTKPVDEKCPLLS